MDGYLRHIITTLEGLTGDHVVVGAECQISGTTVTITMETRQAWVNASPLRYLANCLQLPDIPEDSTVSFSMADHNIQV